MRLLLGLQSAGEILVVEVPTFEAPACLCCPDPLHDLNAFFETPAALSERHTHGRKLFGPISHRKAEDCSAAGEPIEACDIFSQIHRILERHERHTNH